MTLRSRGILTYLLLVFTLSLAPYLLVIRAHTLATGGGLIVGVLMWMPAAAAFLTCRILGIEIASLGWRWYPARFEVLAYLVPVLYAIPVYVACWLFVPHSFALRDFAAAVGKSFDFPNSPLKSTFLLGIPIYATFGVIRSIASALGEEIGWRGFLLPRLTGTFGWRLGCLISGCIWAVWHYPLLLFADYNSGTPKSVRAYLLHPYGHRGRIHSRLASPSFREPLAVRCAPREPQSLHPGDLRPYHRTRR